jgi:hypothetical protein
LAIEQLDFFFFFSFVKESDWIFFFFNIFIKPINVGD